MIPNSALRLSATVMLVCIAHGALAQTCASPVSIVATGTFTGNTCNSSNQLPYLANGAIESYTNQDIYYMQVGPASSGIVIFLTPEAGVAMSVAVCRNQCSTYATCVGAAASGIAGAQQTVTLPDGSGDYYIVVAGVDTGPNCGNYSMSVSMPLGD